MMIPPTPSTSPQIRHHRRGTSGWATGAEASRSGWERRTSTGRGAAGVAATQEHHPQPGLVARFVAPSMARPSLKRTGRVLPGVSQNSPRAPRTSFAWLSATICCPTGANPCIAYRDITDTEASRPNHFSKKFKKKLRCGRRHSGLANWLGAPWRIDARVLLEPRGGPRIVGGVLAVAYIPTECAVKRE